MRKSMVRRKKNFIVLLAFLMLVQGGYTLANSSSEQAQAMFEKAVKLLNRTGGIASFDTLPGTAHLIGPSPIPDEEVGKTLDNVISELHRVIELDPAIKGAYYFLGIAYLRKEEGGEATKAFYKALDIEPDREMTYILLCSLLWNANRYDEALNVGSRYAVQFPQSQVQGAILAGQTYFLMGDFQEALNNGLRILDLDSSRLEGRILAATSYYCLGNAEAAAEQFKILQADPRMSKYIAELEKSLEERCGKTKERGK
jgi:tetratricopeptide (TPR) repeat protein